MTSVEGKGFKSPKRALGDVDTEAMARVVAAAADVSLIVNRKGVILDVAFGSPDFEIPGHEAWVGKRWVDTVSVESRPKVEAMMSEAGAGRVSRLRQVNYQTSEEDVPVLCSVVEAGSKGRVIVLGRELRSIAKLQQRLMSTQQSVEREYARLRQLETRYKLLFQVASEGVAIVDAKTLRITEVNPRAEEMLGRGGKPLAGSIFPSCFEPGDRKALRAVLRMIPQRGESEEFHATPRGHDEPILITASLIRQDGATFILLRLLPQSPLNLSGEVELSTSALLGVVQRLPEGFVVSTAEGNILSANPSFVEMVRAATDEQVKGRSLEDFIGRPGVDLPVMLSNLRQYGSVREFATTLRSMVGTVEDVEVSAAAVSSGEPSAFGLSIRLARSAGAAYPSNQPPLSRSVDELTKLIGHVPLKDLVRETTDTIERLCIEAALELTRDNRASAAEMLGLSRQALYTKLHRYGLADSSDADD